MIDPPSKPSIDPSNYLMPRTPMETTLRYTTHRGLTRKDLAAFIAEVPDDARITVRVNEPHPLERGSTTTVLEATWTTGATK